MGIYELFFKRIFFMQDPENVHNCMIKLGSFLGSNPITRRLTGIFCDYKNEKLNLEIDGVKFENPVGLAAGFDKNARLTGIIPHVGFGFQEIGSMTAKKCEGNPKPRLFRLPKDKALVINYGLCNDGVEAIHERLKDKTFRIPLFISIAKTNDPEIKGDGSVNDYYASYRTVKDLAKFIVLNISCPNSGDGRSFEDPKLLEKLLKKIGKTENKIFLKISPDLNLKNLDAIIKLAEKYNTRRFVVSNLTHDKSGLKSSNEEVGKTKGSVSGPIVKAKSNLLIRHIYKKTNGRFIIIGVGGIFSAEDAYERIKNGATLVQLITGMIYQGPTIIKKINKGLAMLMEREGYHSIKEVVGIDAWKT